MRKIYLLAFLVVAVSCSERLDFSHRRIEVAGLPGDVSAVAAGNLTGTRRNELVLAHDSVIGLYCVKGDSACLLDSIPVAGDQMLLTTGDADGDGAAELLVLAGWRRKTREPVVLYRIHRGKDKFITEELYRSPTPRPQPVSLLINDMNNDGLPEIVASWFESKYFVTTITAVFRDGSWRIEPFAVERMAMSREVGRWSRRDSNQYFVGRVYGDSLGLDGDAYIGRVDRIPLPVRRGVKVIRLGDADNDGRNEIYVADGWHFDYGKIARGRIAVIRREDEAFRYELIEDVKYQYEVSQVLIADVTGDGENELLTHGNRFFRMYRQDPGGWTVFGDTSLPHTDLAVGNILGNRHPEVIFSGKQVEVWQFGHPAFSPERGEEVITVPQDPDSLLGKPAPELSILAWVDGQFTGIGNNRGMVILIDWWATWCGPCIKSFPMIRRLQEEYGPKGLRVIGLTRIDDRQNRQDIEDFAGKEKFPYPVGISVESYNHLVYGVGAIPHVVLIDRKGIIRHYHVGTGEEKALEQQIRKLLAD